MNKNLVTAVLCFGSHICNQATRIRVICKPLYGENPQNITQIQYSNPAVSCCAEYLVYRNPGQFVYFCLASQFWPLKINISQIFFHNCTQNFVRSRSFKYRFRPKCWYLPLKFVPEAVGGENQTMFFRVNFNPLKINIAKIKPLSIKWWGGERRLEKAQTISPNCNETPSPGKIEYNCRYFILTFRTQIHKKKFGKNCFHSLQSTLFHRPLALSSSLKIAPA